MEARKRAKIVEHCQAVVSIICGFVFLAALIMFKVCKANERLIGLMFLAPVLVGVPLVAILGIFAPRSSKYNSKHKGPLGCDHVSYGP